MSLFTRNKDTGVHAFILKVVNNNCPELKAMIEGPRLDRRVNLTVVVTVVPVEKGRIIPERAFNAVTKEFSANGVGLVLSEVIGIEEMVLGFHWEGEMVFIRAVAKHLHPIGGGFYQLGVNFTEMLNVGSHPELRSVVL